MDINILKNAWQIKCMNITEITDVWEYYKIEFEGMSFTIVSVYYNLGVWVFLFKCNEFCWVTLRVTVEL